MDNKFKFNFSKQINISLYIIVAICIAGLICDIVFLTLAAIKQTPFVAYIVSGIILIAIIATIITIKFGSYYKLNDDKFVFSLFCLKKKIDYNDILSIRHDNLTKQTIAYYKTYSKNGEELVVMMNLCVKDLQKVVDMLKEKNNMIIYEIFHKEENNEKN